MDSIKVSSFEQTAQWASAYCVRTFHVGQLAFLTFNIVVSKRKKYLP